MLSYTTPIRLAVGMRKPHRTELEHTMLGFIVLVPLGYWLIRDLLAVLA